MWREVFAACLLLSAVKTQEAVEDVSSGPLTPQDCSLECLRQGTSEYKYCRITQVDVEKAHGSRAVKTLGGCIPWPCFELMGKEDLHLCQHYVHSPNNVTVELVNDPDPTSDTVVISWRPSPYGIAFLRGFQVSLQTLGGFSVFCQLFLFHRNLSLSASHAQKVFKSDPFPGLPLGSQYAITVMALPVPEQWDRFYHSATFSTRSCAEKNGLNECKTDWYPQHVNTEQNGTTVAVTFNLAPQKLGIRGYFSVCYADGKKSRASKVDITPNLRLNQTHHTYDLQNLKEGVNYTCEIAADVTDAVRKTFTFQVKHSHKGAGSSLSSTHMALLLAVVLALAIIIVLISAFTLTKIKRKFLKLTMIPDSYIIKECQETNVPEQIMPWPMTRASPPRLLICYSRAEGPSHVKAVMKLGAFIQQHMATQVCLDLWDSLNVAEEGSFAWHSRQINECDFVLVLCSPSLSLRPSSFELSANTEDEEASWETENSCAKAIISLIGAEVGRAKAKNQDLSKYMAAIFDHFKETDIPTELGLMSHYTLASDFPLLFSHIHGVSLHRPGGYLKISHISEEGFTELPAGAALQSAIREAGDVMKARRQSHLVNK